MFRGHTQITRSERYDTGQKDRYGNPVYAYRTVTMWGDLTPLASEEFTDAQQQVITRYRVILPNSAVIAATDRITVDGLEYEVKGDAEPHRLRGQLHHHEAIVERVTG